MKHHVTLYSPPAPDFGGLNGRFARVWLDFLTDLIGAICVMALPFLLMFIAYGWGL